jgi:hypothetical protein
MPHMKWGRGLLLATLLGCAGTFAAAQEAAPETCASLSKKYDEADKSNVAPAKLQAAERSRRHGRGLCATGNAAAGMRALRQALALIGVSE